MILLAAIDAHKTVNLDLIVSGLIGIGIIAE